MPGRAAQPMTRPRLPAPPPRVGGPASDVAQPWRYAGLAVGVAAGWALSLPVLAIGAAAAVGYVVGAIGDNGGIGRDAAAVAEGATVVGTGIRDFISPLILTDSEQVAVSVDLEPHHAAIATSTDQSGTPLWRADQIIVRSINIGRGRLTTGRSGNLQGKHTVAWTLLISAMERLAGRRVDLVLGELFLYAESLVRNPEQTERCLEFAKAVARNKGGDYRNARMALQQWNRMLTGLIKFYVQAYQLSKEASVTGRSHYRNEDDHRNALIVEEERLRQEFPPGLTATEAADHAEGLLEVNFSSAFSKLTYARSVWLWLRLLGASYPRVMATHGATIRAQVLNQPVAVSWQEADVATVGDLVVKYRVQFG
jgi:hypothetical protein